VIDWRRNLVFVWIAQVLSLVGFSFALPFAPFYLHELGVNGEQTLRLWSGLFMAGAGIPLAIMTPIWGFMADHWGRKSMTLRATLGGAAVLFAMGLVRTPGALLALRVLQGVFTGTVTANLTLVVSTTPEDRIGFAIGVMNSAVFAGNAVGPLIGGTVADAFGFRTAFFLSSLSLFASFLVALFLVKEEFTRRPLVLSRSPVVALRSFFGEFGILFNVGLIMLLGLSRFTGRPIYPLLVRQIAAPGLGVATQTGLVNAAAGVAAVLAGILVGRRADRSRQRPREIYLIGILCAILAAGFFLPQGLTPSVWLLLLLVFCSEFWAGGLDPVLNMLLARKVPPERRGVAFGLAGSAKSIGWSTGSMLGGALAAYLGFLWVFVAGALLFGLTALLLARARSGALASGGRGGSGGSTGIRTGEPPAASARPATAERPLPPGAPGP
jgi:DHA1 family multidrug resistance protein-like MFS transporter